MLPATATKILSLATTHPRLPPALSHERVISGERDAEPYKPGIVVDVHEERPDRSRRRHPDCPEETRHVRCHAEHESGDRRRVVTLPVGVLTGIQIEVDRLQLHEIGRASCRERV